LTGFKEKQRIPEYQMAADMLVLPNIPSTKESEKYTSPIKMFEYMASGVPIIASDMPSLREVLNDHNATLIPPGRCRSFARCYSLIFIKTGIIFRQS
jgi:glycosyltransferase involved in cell wall biosynthesis